MACFEDGTLPKAEWTHEAHLRVGLWYCAHRGAANALSRLREGIRRYNEAVGGVNSAVAGSHETITRFYVWRIARFVAERRLAAGDALAAHEAALLAECGDRTLPLAYWSTDELFSRAARLGWVPPDRRPLETPPPAPTGDPTT